MSHVIKFLKDDHARIRRTIAEYQRTPTMAKALSVCDTLAIHLKIERELIYAAIWDSLNDTEEKVVGDADDLTYQRMEAVETMKGDDPNLANAMVWLARAFRNHVEASEHYIEPRLESRADGPEMGAEAFRRWQAEFESNRPRAWRPMDRLANTGWGGGGKVHNAGW